MRIEYVPTLTLQRELYDMPRDMSRFKRYLWEMTHGTEDLVLPLVAFNPMGREHVAHALDTLIALDADAVVAEALRVAAEELPGDLLLHSTLVLADDIGGMWSHRATNEFKTIYEWGPQGDGGWVLPGWWVSEEPSPAALTREARRALYREAYRMAYGKAESLTDVLLQEGFALRFADPDAPLIADAHLLDRWLRARDIPTLVAALFGDATAIELGYAPLGLPAYGGFEVARAIAAASAHSPVEWLRV